MLRDRMVFGIKAPSDVSTHTLLTVPLTALGITADNIAAATFRLLGRRNMSTGAAVPLTTEVLAVSGTSLTITEGSTGFDTNTEYIVEAVLGYQDATAVASTPQ